jgi:hypothetical protein
MKLTHLTALLVLATLSGTGVAQQRHQALPEIPAPRELTETSSDFAEGTITRLSDQDVSQFLPWAQNAQSVLTKAIRDAETMTVQNQVRHLTAIMKSVVRHSAQKNYQMFMRFSLNRTLLLVQELMAQADWSVAGTVENVLDLQVRGIQLALEFYESDLAYQRRAARGQNTVTLEHARFGAAFGKTMLASIQNVTDASAQYRLLYKTLEMINWDFSRDAQAIEIADTIVEIYNTLNTLEERPGNDDYQTVLAIRRLNVLLDPVHAVDRTILMSKEKEARRQIEEQKRIDELEHKYICAAGCVDDKKIIDNRHLMTATAVTELEADLLAKQTTQRTRGCFYGVKTYKCEAIYTAVPQRFCTAACVDPTDNADQRTLVGARGRNITEAEVTALMETQLKHGCFYGVKIVSCR